MSEEEAKFRDARRAANEARKDELTAALHRFRNPNEPIRIKVSLKKPIRAKRRAA